MKLIVGLGNPGKKYFKTRHNLGFMVTEKITQKLKTNFLTETKFEAKIAEVKNQERVFIVQPQTYMNNSGQAISKIKNYFKIDLENIWVIYDDVDLTFGRVRLGLGGSSAGHKGVQSIIDRVGEYFWRIRIGIGKDEKMAIPKRVLENFTKFELKTISKIVDKVSDLVIESLSNNLKEGTIKIG